MKRFVLPIALLCFSVPSFAQKDKTITEKKTETVVIKKEKNKEGQTIIEIRDGKVFVDGEQVAGVDDPEARKITKKIIIDSDGDAPLSSLFGNDNASSPRAMLGVATKPDEAAGAVVESVSAGSPAEKAGIQAGDRITKIDGLQVADPKDLVAKISMHKANDVVKVAYQRNGSEAVADATLSTNDPMEQLSELFHFGPGGQDGSMPDIDFSDLSKLFQSGGPKLGVVAENLSDRNGVVVTEVKPGTPAAKFGLMKGDVITAFDGPVKDVNDLQLRIRSQVPGEKKPITYQRDGKTKTGWFVFPKESSSKEL